ncbi:MAG: hypothetical protein U5R46_09030 [Gammaproteobacteria bacterium]|nr:hypothetical protein [Gammaproteobacteria bacterium]
MATTPSAPDKLVRGSSMATLAAITPLVAPFLESGNLSPLEAAR